MIISITVSFCPDSFALDADESVSDSELEEEMLLSSESFEHTVQTDEEITNVDVSNSFADDEFIDESLSLPEQDAFEEQIESAESPLAPAQGNTQAQDVAQGPTGLEGQELLTGSDAAASNSPAVADGSKSETPLAVTDSGLDSPEETADASGENDAQSEASRLILLRVLSEQPITFTLTSGSGPLVPVTEAEISSYLEIFSPEVSTDALPEPDDEDPVYVFHADYLLLPGSYRWSAEAAGYVGLDDVLLEVPEDMPWGADLTVCLTKKVLPFGFRGMPEGNTLSDHEIAAKATLQEHGLPDSMLLDDYEEGTVLLLTSDRAYAEAVAAAYSADLSGFYGTFAELSLHTATTLEAVTAAADPEIPLPAVEPNWIVHLDPTSFSSFSLPATYAQSFANDPYEWADWTTSLGLNDPLVQTPAAFNYQWMHDAVNSYAAWGVTMGSSTVRVAVLDTGIDTDHEDFAFGSLVQPGVNTVTSTSTSDVEDDAGHGTHVAGIIAAQGFNGTGGVGIAPGVTLLPVRVLTATSGSTSAVARGISWAVAHEADIINMSLGGPSYSSVLEAAVESAYQAGVTVVAAMSNNSYGGSNIRYYPAAYDHVIGVGAADQSGNRANYSLYGSWCDVYAPGSNIWSCTPGSGYRSDSGTSMACPVVTGIAALYMSVYGHQDPDTMLKILQNTSDQRTGIPDAAKLFSSDRTAPVISAQEADESEAVARNGTVSLTNTGYLSVDSAFPDDGSRILYTIDGNIPSMLNGEIRVGTWLPEDGHISLTEFEVGRTLTIRAVCVNGLGVASEVASLKVRIITPLSPEIAEQLTVEITNLPETYLVAGRTWQFHGKIFSSLGTAVDQRLVWSIKEQDTGLNASINKITGLLTTRSKTNGKVVVCAASSQYPESPEATATVIVKTVSPTDSVSLSQATAVLYNPSEEGLILNAVCRDAQKNVLDNTAVGLSWASSNQNVATVDSNGLVTPVGKGVTIIRATTKDGSDKTANCRVIVRQYVTRISPVFQEMIAPGESVLMKVQAMPSDAHNKDVTWELKNLSPKDADIQIRYNRLVHVGKTVPIGTSFELVATAKDGSGTKSEAFKVRVMPQTNHISISPDNIPILPTVNSRGDITGAMLFRLEQPTVPMTGGLFVSNNTLCLRAECHYGRGISAGISTDAISWSSSNQKVATVDGQGTVIARGLGTATIFAYANDSSGVKARFNVRVINPISSLMLVSAAPLNCQSIAFGCRIKTIAALGDTYGKPTLPTLRWSFTVRNGKGFEDDALTEMLQSKRLIILNSSGLLTIQTGARDYDVGSVTVTAESQDGSNLSDSITYTLIEGTTSVKIWNYSFPGRTSTSSRSDVQLDSIAKSIILPIKSTQTFYIACDSLCNTFEVSSSNPEVAGALIGQGVYYDSAGRRQTFVQLSVTSGMKTGSTIITVRSCDGTGKSTSMTVRVNP